MARPKAVIFDIGNVLIEWQPERFFDQIMPVDERRRMFETVDLHAMNDVIDRGGPFRQTVYATADESPEFGDVIRLWHDRWLDLADPAINSSVTLFYALRKRGIRTMILSNIGRETYELALGRYPFLADFDDHFVSGRMGVIKPEPEIYARLEQASGLKAQDLLFTDDRMENITGAAQRGWQTHLFDGPSGWADRLVELGLLNPLEAALVI